MDGWTRSGDFLRISPARGLTLHVHAADRFKTLTVEALLRRDLRAGATSFALLPLVLRRGTRRLPTMQALSRSLDEMYGADMESDTAKAGETHVMLLRVAHPAPAYVPEGDALLEASLGLLAESLADPALEGGRFPAAVVAGEAANLRRLLRSLVNNREQYAQERLVRLMCPGERYSVFEYGSEEELAEVTPGSLTEFWARGIRTWPLDVFVVGGVDPDRAAELVARGFAWERDAIEEPPPAARGEAPAEPRRFEEPFPVEQTRLVQGYRLSGDPVRRDFPAFLVLNEILGGPAWSRLFRTVRETEGLAYDVGSAFERLKGLLFTWAGVPPGREDQVLGEMAREIGSLQEERVGDAELQAAKSRLASDIRASFDSPAALIAEALDGVLTGGATSIRDLAESVERVSATEVQEAARAVRLDSTFLLRPGG
jgi:predicted Zn-dependent peptidase